MVRQPLAPSDARGRHRHQRQDHHRHPPLRALHQRRPQSRPALHRRKPRGRQGLPRPQHHTFAPRNQPLARRDGRRRMLVLRHGSVEPRHGAAAHGGSALLRRNLHQHHPRPPGLSQDLRQLHRRQKALLRPAARDGMGAHQHRRLARRRDAPEHGGLAQHLLAAQRRHLPHAREGERHGGHGARHRRQRGAHALRRPVQRLQPHRRLRRRRPLRHGAP